jgi:hypothetical protein
MHKITLSNKHMHMHKAKIKSKNEYARLKDLANIIPTQNHSNKHCIILKSHNKTHQNQ